MRQKNVNKDSHTGDDFFFPFFILCPRLLCKSCLFSCAMEVRARVIDLVLTVNMDQNEECSSLQEHGNATVTIL